MYACMTLCNYMYIVDSGENNGLSVIDQFVCTRWSACEVQSGSRSDHGGVSDSPEEVHVRARQKDKDHSKTVHQVSHCEPSFTHGSVANLILCIIIMSHTENL